MDAPKAPKIGPDDRAEQEPNVLLPLGAGNKPLGPLAPILSVPQPLRNPNDKPKDDRLAAERVRLHAKDQIVCPVPYRNIEAKKITDDRYRINFLALDTGSEKEQKKRGCGQVKPELIIQTFKRVHSVMVRVVWGDKVILTAMP